MKIAYKSWKPTPTSLLIVERADAIAAALAADGFTLTLRQLYYQFVALDAFPDDWRWRWTGKRWVHDDNGTKNAEPNYDRLGSLIERGRMAGLIDWDHIVDRTRRYEHVPHWDNAQHILRDDASQFRLDKWIDQEFYVEAWVEKEALIDVVAQPARRNDIGWFAARGYASASSQHEAADRFDAAIDAGKQPVILHLGDHDPSGIDMSRDIYARINTFVEQDTYGGEVEVRRLALNMDQVLQYNPPPNPAKTTDSRFAAYARRFGESSWELDALDPPTINALITAAVAELRTDEPAYEKRVAEEAEHRRLLASASARWADVTTFLNQGETS